MTMIGNRAPVRAQAFSWSWENRSSKPAISAAVTACLDIFSPPPGDKDVINQLERDSRRDAIDELDFADELPSGRGAGAIERAVFDEDGAFGPVATANFISEGILQQVAAARGVPQVMVRIADREVRFEDLLYRSGVRHGRAHSGVR
jgi:hypothetical protein